jgi:hypothetical protein
LVLVVEDGKVHPPSSATTLLAQGEQFGPLGVVESEEVEQGLELVDGED